MRYWVAAISDKKKDLFACEIEAANFNDAIGITRQLLRSRIGETGRITTITEWPADGRLPIPFEMCALAAGKVHAEAIAKWRAEG